MLSKFDDYPIHQTAEPVLHTASSDRFVYDRYWYNGHAQDGSFYFGVAMCRYANLGILDCSLSLAIDGKQYAFHGSRRAPHEPTDTSVGPFSLQILEPMGRHRVLIEPNDTGIECDLVFTPRTACIEEGRQTLRNERHVVMDATRLDQFGFWSGWIRFEGRELQVDGATTFGLKDRSWGIRPVGDAYSGGAPLDAFQAVHFFWASRSTGRMSAVLPGGSRTPVATSGIPTRVSCRITRQWTMCLARTTPPRACGRARWTTRSICCQEPGAHVPR